MKNALTSSVRKVLLGVFMAFAAVCYTSAETSMWTTSYFEKELAKSTTSSNTIPAYMAPMRIIAKFQDGCIWFAIRTYYDAVIPCPVQVSYMYGSGYSLIYSNKTATYHTLREIVDTDRYAILEGTGGNWVKMLPTTSEQLQYYSVSLVSVSMKVLNPDYVDFFENGSFTFDSSVREAFETCSLVAPGGNLNLICTIYS